VYVYVSVVEVRERRRNGAMPDLAANRVGGAEVKRGPTGPAEGSPERGDLDRSDNDATI
jgi:hypothetical protein